MTVHMIAIGSKNTSYSIINKPESIYRSNIHANRFSYYRRCFLSQLGRDEIYMRIVIEYYSDEKQNLCGRVITAMSCYGPKLGEALVWRGQAI